MAYTALIIQGAFALTVCVLLAQALRYRERSWERKEAGWSKERADLLNRIMYLTDKPWSVPEPPEPEPQVFEPVLLYPDMDVLE